MTLQASSLVSLLFAAIVIAQGPVTYVDLDTVSRYLLRPSGDDGKNADKGNKEAALLLMIASATRHQTARSKGPTTAGRQAGRLPGSPCAAM
jgi:hypothetical protein